MTSVVRCPHCAKAMQVPENAAGKTVKCPNCGQLLAVPNSAAAPRPEAISTAKPSKEPRLEPPPKAETNGFHPPADSTAKCPSCGTPLLEGAIACMDCGYLLAGATGTGEVEGPPNLCVNPACGVANPPGERTCQRCGNPLPISGGTLLHGRYRLNKLLKMGGFGAVYRATDTKQGNREVAIKDMIGDDPQEFAIRLNFFRREAEILRSLDSLPIVPRILDFIHQGQTAHLVMEFIRGKDLLDLLDEGKRFPVSTVVEWGKSICDVLDHMHRLSPPVIHRDLKPDNLMLLEDQRSIKMIDFGTARDLGRTSKERFAGKTRVYTEGYAPPEQIVGRPEARSDLFALAATLYHLATGIAPEGFHTAKDVEEHLAKPKSPDIAAHRWFFEMLKINLAEDANDRYFSAREFKADLQRQRVTREIACPKCKTTNPVRTPFCVKCAEPLTESAAPCAMCGKDNRMGSRCCIYCGNRLR